MTKEIKIVVTSPIKCTDEQYQEWAEYCLGYRGSISTSNPLHEYDLDADDIDIN